MQMSSLTVRPFVFGCLMLLLGGLFVQCQSEQAVSSEKMVADAPQLASEAEAPNTVSFLDRQLKPQRFTLDPKRDHVVEGLHGTRLVVPKGCFKNAKGETITEGVELELTEALDLDQMIYAGLNTNQEDHLLQSGGMLHLKASANGEPVRVDPDLPLYIEVPTEKRVPGMQAYEGTRGPDGKMNWTNPKDLDNFLVTVDQNLLNYLPEGFAQAVEEGLPFRHHTKATDRLVDSLYYSLSTYQMADTTIAVEEWSRLDNEPYENSGAQVVDGQYTSSSYAMDYADSVAIEADTGFTESCGIDPASIKAIRSPEYAPTFLATRAFEKRLQTLFCTGRQDLFELYVNQLERPLWEIDEQVTRQLGKTAEAYQFQEFAAQRLTNVKDAGRYAVLLRGFYNQKFKETKAELEAAHQAWIDEIIADNQKAEQLRAEYQEVLWKREKYRMETYGFQWSNTGWVNVDVGIVPKQFARCRLEVNVEAPAELDRVYTYVVFGSIQSLYRLNTQDEQHFYAGNPPSKSLLMPPKRQSICYTIGYVGEEPYFAQQTFVPGKKVVLEQQLQKSDKAKISKLINSYKSYRSENQIGVDLDYMEKFYQEKLRRKRLQSEHEFMLSLKLVAFPCEGEEELDEGVTKKRAE